MVTNEILALLICWAVGTIMARLEQLTVAAKPKAKHEEHDEPEEEHSVLSRFATGQEQLARIEALRIVAQERLKEISNGNKQ